MIVVVGQPLFRAADEGATADGLPARIALAAAGRGRSVQLVGKAGEDSAGDAVVLALSGAGVGHVALLRDAGILTPRAIEQTGFDLDATADVADAAEATDTAGESPVLDPATVAALPGALEAADVELALRYLTDFAVVVLADSAGVDVTRVVADASGWAGAQLILVLAPGQSMPDGLPADAIVFEAPAGDPDDVFASFVGSFAAALDNGEEPGDAFRSSIDADGWAASTGS